MITSKKDKAVKNKTITALSEKLGVPTRETKKALAWDITSGFGVVVQIDQPSTGEYALVWLPHNTDALNELSCENVVYPEEKGRHSNTYASPGLKRGDAAIRTKVKTEQELNELLCFLFDPFY